MTTSADFPGWEDVHRRETITQVAPVLAIDGFEGPLDWLLELARAKRIDLARLSILALVDAFAGALEVALARDEATGLRLMAWGDWLVMAATLTLLRSRLLLPAGSPEAGAARDEAETLRRQLLERAEIAAAAGWLERQTQLGREVFARGQKDQQGARAGRVGDITELFRACLVALRLPVDAEATFRLPPPPLWTVSQAIARIRAMLPFVGERGGKLEAFLPAVPAGAPERPTRCRAAVAGTFVATLELAREGVICVEQHGIQPTVHPGSA